MLLLLPLLQLLLLPLLLLLLSPASSLPSTTCTVRKNCALSGRSRRMYSSARWSIGKLRGEARQRGEEGKGEEGRGKEWTRERGGSWGSLT
jgi:hypothetical protein